MNDETMKGILDNVIKEEYGGCDPRHDAVCVLKARVIHDPPDHRIEVFVVGKWRPIRYYGGVGYIVTNKKILAEMERTIRINTGSYNSSKPLGSQYDPSRGTFAGKKIIFEWF